MALLSAEEARRVEEAVATAEARTAGEIVVVVVARSERYEGSRALLAALWTIMAATAAAAYLPWHVEPLWLLVAQLPALALGFWLAGWGPLLRTVLPPGRAARAVHERALRAFAEHGVHRTRDRSGLLILISALERRVEILGDDGIHQRVGAQGWAEQVTQLVAAVREGRPGDGLVSVIEQLGALLSAHFPRRSDDTNELPDTPRQ
ncbi:MAG: TPM domain-containing protein [Proteobacteria bacterium]|nr:TPM domain-containing protein [Pseudomonadota bacterium]